MQTMRFVKKIRLSSLNTVEGAINLINTWEMNVLQSQEGKYNPLSRRNKNKREFQ